MAQTYSSAAARPMPRYQGAAKRDSKLPWQIWVFIVVMMLPHTLAFYAGPVLVTTYRLAMIGMAIPIAIRLTSGRVKLGWPDALIGMFAFWSIMCIFMNFGLADGLERAGQLILETVLAYFLSRLFIQNLDHLYGLVRPLFAVTVIALVLAIPEAISHQKPIIEITSKATGMSPGFYAPGTDVRMGLRRAQAFFENPILYGLFCASCLSLVWYTERVVTTRVWKVAVVIAAVFFSASSAPFLTVSAQFIMIAIEQMTRTMKNRIPIILSVSAAIVAGLQVFTNAGPIGIIVNYLTFNQASSYNRVLIWDFGIQNIIRHPLFGMVPEQWVRGAWMKVSIDNFWIYTGLLSGFVGWGLLTAVLVSIIWKFNKVPLRYLTPRHIQFRRGWTLMIVAVAFTGFSVMFFGKLQPYFYFMLGVGAAAASIYTEQFKREARVRRDMDRARAVDLGARRRHAPR